MIFSLHRLRSLPNPTLCVAFGCLLLPIILSAWTGDEIDFPSPGNGWSTGTNSAKYTGPDGSTEWFRYTLTMPTASSDYEFLMVAGNDFNQKYGGNTIFERDSLDILYYGSGQPNAKLGPVTAGKRYVFTTHNPGLADTFISVQELDADPVNISSVSRDGTTGVITVNLSGSTSPQEKVYIRYSDDGYAHWSVVEATVSGTSATVSIPEIKDGRTYSWYAFTSTATAEKFYNGFAVDALSLAWDNNSGSNFTFSTPNRISQFSVNGAEGAYQTTKFFIDEIEGSSETVDVSVTFQNGTPTEAEVVTNLNRRDKADQDGNSDGVEDGILPPSRDLVGLNETHYFKAYPLTQNGGVYEVSLPVHETGAYRLTVRYRMGATEPWIYYQGRPAPAYGGGDHAIVVSPTKTLEMTLYEINPLTVEASAASQAGRSTFIDLLGSAQGDNDGLDPVNLDYFNALNTNCLWFQPIHPTGGEGVEDDPDTGSPYVPGSPYASKNFFAVNPFLGSANTEASAMSEFQTFMAGADANTGTAGTINVMLDFVANHTAWDGILGQGGIDLGYTATATERIPIHWYSRNDNYGLPARWHNTTADTDIGQAPDRHDFGKWADVAELYFGRYSAQVKLQDGSDINQYKNEDDLVELGSVTPEVVKLWRYFGYYPEYWLQQSGHSGSNSVLSDPVARLAEDDKGIDALRCDFGQGLPNPLWEYIVNRTRAKKWNFVFMAETLDGAEPGYRSNRVFDILNESMVFQFTAAHVNSEADIQTALESRRTTYRTGALLLNTTSHDELLPDNDPWLVATRYGALSSVPGLPMIFYGQEQGIQNHNTTFPTFDGFEHHELNFGKQVPHFKKWNRLRVWDSPPPNNSGLADWFGRVNQARLQSASLQALNQWYLDLRPNGTTPNDNIFAIARFEKDGGSPAFDDVVLAFTNLFEHGAAHATATDTFGLTGGVGDQLWTKLGLENSANRSYQVRDLASSDPDLHLWPSARTGSDLYQNGVFVSLGGGTANAITADGELVQYLKIEDVTPPPSPQPTSTYYQLGTTVTFNWTANGEPDDNISHYLIDVGTSHGGDDVVSDQIVPFGTNQYTFIGVAGTTYYATITAVSAVGTVSMSVGSSDSGEPNPDVNTGPVILLDPSVDTDGDGISNTDEQNEGTNPLVANPPLQITSIAISGQDAAVTFDSVVGRHYRLETSLNLEPDSWSFVSADTVASGTTTTLVHTNGAAEVKRYYRVIRSSEPIP